MNETEAAEVARWLAVAGGHELAEYADPRVSHEGTTWFAHFQGVSGAPGDHFDVVLDESSHESRIVAGR